jgi:N-formylglutamate amidohydrolase
MLRREISAKEREECLPPNFRPYHKALRKEGAENAGSI